MIILTEQECFPLDEQLRQSVLVTQQKWKEKALDFKVELVPARFTGSSFVVQLPDFSAP